MRDEQSVKRYQKMQLLLKAAVAAHAVAGALLLVMLLLIPGLSTKEWCGRPIWRELSMSSGWEAAVASTASKRPSPPFTPSGRAAVAFTAEPRIPQNRVEMEDVATGGVYGRRPSYSRCWASRHVTRNPARYYVSVVQ